MQAHFPERPSEIAALFAADPGNAEHHLARAAQLTSGLSSMRTAAALKKRSTFTAANHKRIAKRQPPKPAVAGRNGFCARGAADHNARFAAYFAAATAANDARPAARSAAA